MKILIAAFLVLCSATCFAQSDQQLKAQVSKIPRGTKTIILTLDSTRSSKDLLAQLVSHIIDKGYEVDNMNSELGMIQTKEKNVKFTWSARFTFLLTNNNRLKIKGKSIQQLDHDFVHDIENKGALGDMYVYTFREMVRVSNGIPNQGIEYSK
ncbi:hypothetical protein J2Y45_006095 [Dyadobacter sp. BE34]|uniref:Uncharacterized protein n=1 Tax=Dyadobacter fermentans TaxID=94254 RepID=A0ABU1R644_9BACT|nr:MULTISPECIES: hypothetical protein [Dyadobacter]MDR6808881.1 hypothetical protein [Dyadobacter fermentans]MDR7046624.1 hypothetical protein [Dyadobacter sp. BE242]MDR7200938.1 hypothetical protein [Dyadobacter sp. BE34]MDR7218898.1 hypothetical protein [Dyadobacter sp. BE31]MDR7264892.1 hypothetical protein [Dyadobacter sp. BE32]